MTQRRMFSLKVIDTDIFLEMPVSSQALYFHLALRADDDGFVANPKRILRMLGMAEDDMKILITKNFVLPFESGVCVIKHWRIHNLLRADRYSESIYACERDKLYCESDGSYSLNCSSCAKKLSDVATKWQPNGDQMAPQVRLGKVSLGKIKKEAAALFDFSGFADDEREAIERWIDHHKRIKKPYTEMGLEYLRTKCIKLSKQKVLIEAVNHSIVSVYQGLFPPNNKNSGEKNATKISSHIAGLELGVQRIQERERLQQEARQLQRQQICDERDSNSE